MAQAMGQEVETSDGSTEVETREALDKCLRSRQNQIYDRRWVSLACFGKLWRARSRRDLRRFLQPNSGGKKQ